MTTVVRRMARESASSVEAVADAIAAYLAARANAADSIDGIAQWWLTGELHGAPISVVQQALEQLIERGIVSADGKESGVTIYRAARSVRHRS